LHRQQAILRRRVGCRRDSWVNGKQQEALFFRLLASRAVSRASRRFSLATRERRPAPSVQNVTYVVMVNRGYTRCWAMRRLNEPSDARKDFADTQKQNEALLFWRLKAFVTL
jgi:hypothetical protein